MNESINNLHFKLIPSVDKIEQCLIKNGVISSLVELKIFEYSSYNPVFYVDAITPKKNRYKFVLRGAFEVTGASELNSEEALLNELEVMKILKGLNIKSSQPLLDGKILHILCKDAKLFKFIPITYIGGIAVDRSLQTLDTKNRKKLLTGIAELYGSVQSVKRNYCGPLVGGGSQLNCVDYIYSKKTVIAEFLRDKIVEEPKIFKVYKRHVQANEEQIRNIFDRHPQLNLPSLVLYDGSAGNMLIDGESIGVIDFDRTIFTCPLVEFCAPLFCLEKFLFNCDTSESTWKKFLHDYQLNGGYLPGEDDFNFLLKDMLIDYLITSSIDGINHSVKIKSSNAYTMLYKIKEILLYKNISTISLIELVRKIKYN